MSRPDWFDDAPETPPPGRGGAGDGGGDGPGGGGGGGGGGGDEPRRPAQAAASPKKGVLGPTLAVLAVLFFSSTVIATLVTDLWWFNSVDFRVVFTTELLTKTVLFVLGFLLTAAAVGVSLFLGYRLRPFVIPVTVAQQTLEQYRRAIEPLRKLSIIAVPAVLGVLAGTAAMGSWQDFLLWRNGGDFGTTDAQFGLDIGFYVFTLPWLRFLVSFLTVVLFLSLAAALVTHYVYGGIQLPGRGPSTRSAIVHIGVIGAVLALVRAGAYWLDRYAQTTAESSLITGVTYTGDHAIIPTRTILAVAAIMCALFFIASFFTKSLRLPIIGVALLTVTAVIVGSIYPALVQALKVQPSQRSLEGPYITRNIEATRAAYGLDDIETTPYAAVTEAEPGQLRDSAETIPGIRLVDPNVVTRTFQQFEGLRQYYAFPDSLDVDRYEVDGKVFDSVVAVRELRLSGVPAAQRNWVNDHTVYTHGYGFVAAYGNQRTSEGDPVFFSGGLGTESKAFGEYEPRVYFGEESPVYSVVGAPEGEAPREFDFPDDAGQGGQASNTYSGEGGVSIGSFLRKLAYMVKYREPKLILSEQVNSESRILDHRTPVERVKRVAPWLTLDGNALPAVVDGRIQWIVDGYTTTARYPNSWMVDLADATSDSVSEQSRVVGISTGKINYIRNSVKATVDAYDGTVKIYAWDADEPILKAWSEAFPGTVSPMSEMSAELMSHVRYPQDLFKVQRQILARYHVTDADSFFTGQDFWRVPKDPSHDTQDQPAYYQSLAMPDQDSPTFSLVTTFIPTGTGREILRGFLAVDADAGTEEGKASEDYGKLRLLELPRASAVDGPGQIQNQIKVSAERSQSPTEPLNLSQFITQNSQSGKTLTFGNLLTLPVGGGLLYVQPMYVQASREGGSFPQIKATAAVFGKKVAWGETLDQALDGLFGGESGASAGDSDVQPEGEAGQPGTTPTPGTPATGNLAAALEEVQAAYAAGQEALRRGDFTAYGAAQQRLEAAITAATAAAGVLPAPDGSASADGGASPEPEPSPTN